MRRVVQKGNGGEEGCGAACVAMIAGVTYDEARSRLPAHCDTRGTTSEELRAALQTFSIETEKLQPIGRADHTNFPFDAVLRGKLDEEDEHWAVWEAERGRVLDPYKPGGEFRCTSFIKVVR